MSVLLDRALGLLEHLHVDPESDQLLTALFTGLLDNEQARRLSLIAHGDDTRGPWEVITNPAKAELWSLEAAGQWVGATVPGRMLGESDADFLTRARREMARPRSMRRGSVQSLIDIGVGYLTGAKACRIVENLGGDEWRVGFICRPAEIVDQDALTAALNAADVIWAGMRVEVIPTDSALIDEMTRTIDGITVAIDDITLPDVT